MNDGHVYEGAALNHPLVRADGNSLYQCLILIAGECREVYEMQRDIKDEVEGNEALYNNLLARPCSSRTPVDVLPKLEAFATLYACNIKLWGLVEYGPPDRSLILLRMANHGRITHHFILLFHLMRADCCSEVVTLFVI